MRPGGGYEGCFLVLVGVARKRTRRAIWWLYCIRLTVPCPNRTSHSHYGFAFHSRRSGNYYRAAAIPWTCRAGDGLTGSPHSGPFRTCLIDPVYSVPRDRDDVGLRRSGRNIVVSK